MRDKVRLAPYVVSGKMFDELQTALQREEVPELRLSYSVIFKGEIDNAGGRHSSFLAIEAKVGKNTTTTEAKRQARFEALAGPVGKIVGEVPPGTLDMVEEGIRRGLESLFPQLRQIISNTSTIHYQVRADGEKGSHAVRVSMGFEARNIGEKATYIARQGVTCSGADTVLATIECLRCFFNWLLWRCNGSLRRAIHT